MKVRSLLLSMCAIVALASCSKNDDGIPGGGSDAPEAKVILKLVGNSDQVTSKAAGIPGDLDTKNGTVNNLTVFIFNQSGIVITKQYIGAPTAANSISTTTDAKKVAVVANTGDMTGAGGAFASVASEDALKAVLSDMLVTPDVPTGGVTHTDANLYMSGIDGLSEFAKDGETMKATATVQLHYLSARIQLTEITFNGGGVKDNVYAQANDFATNTNANFTITRVYLMNAQRVTHFLPATDGNSDYITQDLKQYTGGVAWGDPWKGQAPNQFKPNDEYTIEAAADKFTAVTNKISDIGHWYTFANTDVSDIAKHPTALVVEVLWRKTKANEGEGVAEELKPMYFTTYFGGGDKEELAAGKAYTVKLALNGNFKPTNEGGSGGGGTEDPTKPTVNSSVAVTVNAATWVLATEISKEWK
ncbi:fimbrial protein [Parabacteroides sp. APC149_11_2_Y6]